MTRQHPRGNRRTSRKCDSPICDRLAGGPNALGVTEGESAVFWHLCSPDCLKTWISLAVLRVAYFDRREAEEAEA